MTVAGIIILVILTFALLRFTAELRSAVAELKRNVALDQIQQARLEATVDRMERATKVVAVNLADSVSRADATTGPEGAAADAALRTGDTVAAIHERQGDNP